MLTSAGGAGVMHHTVISGRLPRHDTYGLNSQLRFSNFRAGNEMGARTSRGVRWRGCLCVEYGFQGSKIAGQEQRRIKSQTSEAFTQQGKRNQKPCRQFALEEIPLLSSLRASLSWRGEYNVGQATSSSRIMFQSTSFGRRLLHKIISLLFTITE